VIRTSGASRILLICILGAAVSCRRAPNSSTVQGSISEGSDYLWPNATVSVCWETTPYDPDFAKFAKLRQTIQQLVTSEYARADFRFTGWGNCETASRGLRVARAPDNSGGRVEAFGQRGDGLFGGVKIMMQVQKSEGCPNPEYCVLTNALHEFGHAIGLRHEANRRDSPCAEDQTGGMGEEVVGMLPMTPYDPQSIMNYCSNMTGWRSARPPHLSDGDIATIKAYYAGGANPRQDACRRDGHSWVAEGSGACCLQSPGGRVPTERTYEFCQSGPGIDNGQRQLVGKAVDVAVPTLQWRPELAIIRCADGERVGDPMPASSAPTGGNGAAGASLGGYRFVLKQGAEMGSQKIECSGVDFFDRREQNQATRVARFEFNPARTFDIPSAPERIDLSGSSPTIHPVRNGVVESGSGSEPGSASDTPNAQPIVPDKDGGLYISLQGIDPQVQVVGGKLTCDGEVIRASANAKHAANSSEIYFLLPLDKSGRQLNCQELSALLVKPQGQPGGPSRAPSTQSVMQVTFRSPLVMKLGRVGYTTSVTVPQCVLDELNNLPTPAPSTGNSQSSPGNPSAGPSSPDLASVQPSEPMAEPGSTPAEQQQSPSEPPPPSATQPEAQSSVPADVTAALQAAGAGSISMASYPCSMNEGKPWFTDPTAVYADEQTGTIWTCRGDQVWVGQCGAGVSKTPAACM
jgi:hypothetical protein